MEPVTIEAARDSVVSYGYAVVTLRVQLCGFSAVNVRAGQRITLHPEEGTPLFVTTDLGIKPC
jgi:hypothetical protein